MFEDEILFNAGDSGITHVKVVKLDELNVLRPSLYLINNMSISDLYDIHSDDVDVFDSLFMSVVTSLLLKDMKLNINFVCLVTSIVSFELKIALHDDDDIVKSVLEYLNVFSKVILTKFGTLVDIHLDNIIDVNFLYNGNKSTTYIILAV